MGAEGTVTCLPAAATKPAEEAASARSTREANAAVNRSIFPFFENRRMSSLVSGYDDADVEQQPQLHDDEDEGAQGPVEYDWTNAFAVDVDEQLKACWDPVKFAFYFWDGNTGLVTWTKPDSLKQGNLPELPADIAAKAAEAKEEAEKEAQAAATAAAAAAVVAAAPAGAGDEPAVEGGDSSKKKKTTKKRKTEGTGAAAAAAAAAADATAAPVEGTAAASATTAAAAAAVATTALPDTYSALMNQWYQQYYVQYYQTYNPDNNPEKAAEASTAAASAASSAVYWAMSSAASSSASASSSSSASATVPVLPGAVDYDANSGYYGSYLHPQEDNTDGDGEGKQAEQEVIFVPGVDGAPGTSVVNMDQPLLHTQVPKLRDEVTIRTVQQPNEQFAEYFVRATFNKRSNRMQANMGVDANEAVRTSRQLNEYFDLNKWEAQKGPPKPKPQMKLTREEMDKMKADRKDKKRKANKSWLFNDD